MIERAEQLLQYLADEVAPPWRGAEIGVYRGAASARLLQDDRVHQLIMVDPWHVTRAYAHTGDGMSRKPDRFDEHYAQAMRVTEFALERRTVLRTTSMMAARKVKPHALDFVYIDGDHAAFAVAADIAIWSTRVKPRCLVTGHDWGHPKPWVGVEWAVRTFAARERLTITVGNAGVWKLTLPEDWKQQCNP